MPWPSSETLIFRASLTKDVYRAFEIADTSSLYALAQAITRSFDFDFDHAFGFYSKLKGNIYDSPVRYELFVDMGEADGEARSVKRTRAIEAFPFVGNKMRSLFDYGDGWEFLVELVKRKPKEPKVKLPRLLLLGRKGAGPVPRPGGRVTRADDQIACKRKHACCSEILELAEREGFEPPIRLPVFRISSAARSTTLPPLRGRKGRKRPIGRPLCIQPGKARQGWPGDAVLTDHLIGACS